MEKSKQPGDEKIVITKDSWRQYIGEAGIVVAFIVLVTIVHPGWWGLMGMIVAFMVVHTAYQVYKGTHAKGGWAVTKTLGLGVVSTAAILAAVFYLGKWGVIGFFIITFGIAGWRLWAGRKLYWATVEFATDAIFGKPKGVNNGPKRPRVSGPVPEGKGHEGVPAHDGRPMRKVPRRNLRRPAGDKERQQDKQEGEVPSVRQVQADD